MPISESNPSRIVLGYKSSPAAKKNMIKSTIIKLVVMTTSPYSMRGLFSLSVFYSLPLERWI